VLGGVESRREGCAVLCSWWLWATFSCRRPQRSRNLWGRAVSWGSRSPAGGWARARGAGARARVARGPGGRRGRARSASEPAAHLPPSDSPAAGRAPRAIPAHSRAAPPPLAAAGTNQRRHATRVARALRKHQRSPPRPGRAKVTPWMTPAAAGLLSPCPVSLACAARPCREGSGGMHEHLSVLFLHLHCTHLPFVTLPDCPVHTGSVWDPSLFWSGGVFEGVHAREGRFRRVGVRGHLNIPPRMAAPG
jgi:hypothetical protein